MKDYGKKATCLTGSIIFAVLLTEMLLRIIPANDGFMAARELTQFRLDQGLTDFFTVDPDFGFRPKLGEGFKYNEFGTLTNSYSIEKAEQTKRVLFVGDSVTARGPIVNSLRRLYGDSSYEYWNAGVESFNTVQEVDYYLKFNHKIQPDHVVLTFHLNDFETTPVTFMSNGRLVVYAPNMPLRHMNPVLFRYSMIYRLILSRTTDFDKEVENVVADTESAIVRLHNELSSRNIKFSVVVFSYLKPLSEWSDAEKLSYHDIIDILTRNEIRYLDVMPVLQNAMMQGRNIRETPNDDWHPNEAISADIAAYLKNSNLL